MRLNKDLREFIELLNANRVEYVVVGAHAVAWHGYPRFTSDIDFFVRPAIANGESIVATLRGFGFGAVNLTAADFARPDQIVQLGVPPQPHRPDHFHRRSDFPTGLGRPNRRRNRRHPGLFHWPRRSDPEQGIGRPPERPG
jgi:hypothetical protein